jgi:Tol biopolymer transport system component
MRKALAILAAAALTAAAAAAEDAREPHYPKDASAAEREALDRLAAEVEGAVVYTGGGHVRKVIIGDWRVTDLGEGDFARWSADGNRLAVYDDGDLYVIDADGSNRTLLVKDADKKDGCPVEFHPNNREVVFWKKKGGFHAADIETLNVRRLNAPGTYTGSACISADGKRMAVRWGHNLYAVDLENKRHHKYASGCSPGVSPDGKLVMNNDGGHRTVTIRGWDGKGEQKIHSKALSPDNRWDNHHWSNHSDYIAAQGERGGGYAYVVNVAANRATRVTWESRIGYPDVWIAPQAEEKGKD